MYVDVSHLINAATQIYQYANKNVQEETINEVLNQFVKIQKEFILNGTHDGVEVQTVMKDPIPKMMIFNLDWKNKLNDTDNEVSFHDLLMVYTQINQYFELG